MALLFDSCFHNKSHKIPHNSKGNSEKSLFIFSSAFEMLNELLGLRFKSILELHFLKKF